MLGAAAFVLYALTLAHGVGWDDSGELGSGVAQLGVVHQTGYPPYVLLGRVFAAIEPFGSEATRVSLWSAVCAAAAVGLAARWVLVAGGTVAGACVAALLVTVGPVPWYQATTASVYPFFLLALMLLLTAAQAWAERPGTARLAWLAAAAGLVLLAHKTGVLFVAGAAALVALHRPRGRQWLGLAALLVPLATILYMPLRDGWGGWPDGLGDATVWEWVTGTAGGTPEADLFGANVHAMATHGWRLVVLLVASLSPAALVLVPAGLAALRRERAYLLCLLAPSVITSVFVLTTQGAFAYWHVPLLLAGALACGAGVPWVLRRRPLAVAAALTLLVAPLFGATYIAGSDREAEGWSRATLGVMPEGARLAAPWTAYAALRATQELDGLRRDVRLELLPPGAPAPSSGGGFAVALDEPPGLAQVGPEAGVNFKGLSGLEAGPVRIGFEPATARTYRLPE